MSLVLDALARLGASGQVLVAAGMAVSAYYLVRGRRLAGTVAALTGSVVGYTVVLMVALAVAIGLGWLDPRPALITDGVDALVSPIQQFGGDLVAWALRQLAEVASA